MKRCLLVFVAIVGAGFAFAGVANAYTGPGAGAELISRFYGLIAVIAGSLLLVVLACVLWAIGKRKKKR